MNDIFKPYLRKFVLCSLRSQTWSEHMLHVKLTLQVLENNQLVIKVSKCTFAEKQVTYLDHVITKEGIAVDSKKVRAMKQWPQPKNIKGLRGIFGLTGYYRKFIRNYGVIAKPMIDLLKKNAYRYDDKFTEAFKKLKQCLVELPILNMSDFNKEFVIECDASGVGIGAVLS